MSEMIWNDYKSGHWLGYVIDQVGRKPITFDPWPHLAVEEIFPPQVYSDLVRYRADAKKDLFVLNPQLPNRKLQWIDKIENDFWALFAKHLLRPELSNYLMEKFALPPGTRSEAQIINDQPGYELGVHTDIPEKKLTGLFYLPGGADRQDESTVLLTSKSGLECGGMTNHPMSNDFEIKVQIPYIPNTALFFPRTNWSFHAVRKTRAERWLIAYDIF